MTLKNRVAALERARCNAGPVLLWLDETETEAQAHEQAGLHPDDPVIVFRWMTAAEAHAHEHP